MIEIVSATRLSESEFWNKAALGISLLRLAKVTRLVANISFENRLGLADVFNARINAEESQDILVFIHDDVWIDDDLFCDRVMEGLKTFDVIGVAGNRRRVKNQPAWSFIDDKFTWDGKANLSGRVAHGSNPLGDISTYGDAPAECELLDGVFLAVEKSKIRLKGVRFDPRFDFHFYDMDFCRSAREKGLRLGTWPISLTHQSGGAFGSKSWLEKYRLYQDKWVAKEMGQSIKQTPMHLNCNPDILKIMPKNLKRVVEVGCSSGALAKAYAKINPECEYTGIEIDPDFAAHAKEYCSEVICGNIESFDEESFLKLFPSDCWIFGDTLEHLYDPWTLIRRIRSQLAQGGQIIACIPNAQHWSIQVNLSRGLFTYQDQGLMDRTHIRWFTRTTMIELFQSAGYKIIETFPRIFGEPAREKVLPSIRDMAIAIGADPQQAVNDAIPLQWVIRAIPA